MSCRTWSAPRCSAPAKILAVHRVEVDLPADLPMLALDMVLFEQVLFNLLDNAAKHAPAGSADPRSRPARTAIPVIVADHAMRAKASRRAMSTDIRKFYRARRRRPPRAGTGLGLAICRGFVEAMGGTIRRRNRPDRSGAVFTITLPVPGPNAPLPRGGGDGHDGRSGPLRVLVVDDEPAIRRFLRAGLSSQGYVRQRTGRRPAGGRRRPAQGRRPDRAGSGPARHRRASR